MSIPYLGSKRSISKQIVDYILADSPNTKYVYDLFGGGGAMSLEFQKRKQIDTVFYNELDSGIVALFSDIINNGFSDKYYQYVTREQFKKNIIQTDNLWLQGFSKVVYSFGNSMRAYIYGKNIEEEKMLAHLFVVLNSEEYLNILNSIFSVKYGVTIPSSILNLKTIKERRFYIKKVVNYYQIQSIESIERIERIERIESIEIGNMSYVHVPLNTPVGETIVYLDPPYKNTGNGKLYNGIKFDYDELYKFIDSCPYTIYMSEYSAPYEVVMNIKKRQIFSCNGNKENKEKLYKIQK